MSRKFLAGPLSHRRARRTDESFGCFGSSTLDQLDAAFPLDVLATECPVGEFLAHYGVAR